MKLLNQIKSMLAENATLVARVAADVVTSSVVLFVVGKSAYISSQFVAGELASNHEPAFVVFLTLAHGGVLVVHGLLIGRVMYVCAKRVFKNIK